MSQVDPRFLQARKQASLRHKRKSGSMPTGLFFGVLGGCFALTALAAGWFIWKNDILPTSSTEPPVEVAAVPTVPVTEFPAEEQPVPIATPTAPEPDAPVRISIDLPGDPLLLQLGQIGGGSAPRRLPRPDALPAPRGGGDVMVIQAPLLEAGERLSVSLPTSPEDFAIFQAQRQRMIRSSQTDTPAPNLSADDPLPRPTSVAEARALVDQARSFSGRLGTGVVQLVPNHARQRPFSDSFLRISRTTDLVSLLQIEGLANDEAVQVAQAAADSIGQDSLEAGQILALRQLRGRDGSARFAQLAIYDGDRYLGALGLGDETRDGMFAPVQGIDIAIAADPWLRQDLPALVDGTAQTGAQGTSSPRVMDALYSAALRHGLSPGQVGQVIMLLAQTHKLDQDATPADTLTLLFSSAPGAAEDAASASDLDQILYVALDSGSETRLRCYVHRPGPERAPACYGPTRGSGPAASSTSSAASGGDTQSLTGGGAVEQLVNRIIQIESAGRADARNPLSTATGLGQFIESTWLRMMRTYRPDLTATLSRGELLALRTDPDISREMVLNLSREGESYLRARGHEITAGRLYLAHFLGMEGAHTALSAAPHEDLLTLFGAGVINANPFLRGRDAGYVVQWAEDRMRGASGRIAVIREPDGLAEFRQIIDGLLTEL